MLDPQQRLSVCLLLLSLAASTNCGNGIGEGVRDQDTQDQQNDSEGGQSGDTNTDACPGSCKACTDQFCSEEWETCSVDLTCKERQKCIDECQAKGSTTAECDERCLVEEWEAFLHTDVSICQGKHCSNCCDRPCGGFTHRVDGCAGCIQAHCCQESKVCANDIPCRSLFPCYTGCTPGDWSCYFDCYLLLNEMNSQLISDLTICYEKNCSLACGMGTSWACVGKTDSIHLSRREMTFSIRFVDKQNNPLSGVTVVMCPQIDELCEQPLVSGQSGTNGQADLTYEIDPMLMQSIRFEISKPGLMPTVLTYSQPFSYNPERRTLVLVTESEMNALADSFSKEIQSDRGHAILFLKDCAMDSARDLIVSTPNVIGSTLYYLHYDFPDFTADRTTSDGTVGILNLPKGFVEIKAAPFDKQESPVLQTNIQIRPGTLTYAVIWPK